MTIFKRYVFLCFVTMSFTLSYAQDNVGQMGPQRGLKGFVEYSGGFGLGLQGTGRATVSGTFGYQINPYIFTGAGFGYDFNNKYKLAFVDVRATLNKKISPFADLKTGMNIDDSRLYFSPTFGCRYGFDNGMAVNLGIGLDYTMTWHVDYISYWDNLWNDNRLITKRTLTDNYSLCVKVSLEL